MISKDNHRIMVTFTNDEVKILEEMKVSSHSRSLSEVVRKSVLAYLELKEKEAVLDFALSIPQYRVTLKKLLDDVAHSVERCATKDDEA